MILLFLTSQFLFVVGKTFPLKRAGFQSILEWISVLCVFCSISFSSCLNAKERKGSCE